MEPTIVLVIPGPWKTREEFLEAVLKAQDLQKDIYLPMANMLVNGAAKFNCFCFLDDADEGLQPTFANFGQGRFSPEELAAIGMQPVVVVLQLQGPTIQSAKHMLNAAAIMLRAGGLAVLVESSGIAHQRDRWLYYADEGGMLCLHDAFVTLVGGREFNFTCGMHALGFPDASVTADYPIELAPQVLTAFNQWQLLQQPTITLGQLFATGLEEQKFTVSHAAYGYEEEHSKNNTHGRYLLTPTDKTFPEDLHFKHNDEPLFMALKKEDTQVCRKKAQATFSYFVRHFDCPYEYGNYMVKTSITDGDEQAYMWLAVASIEKNKVEGVFFEIPAEFISIKVGSRKWIDEQDIDDWSIIKNGTLIGGYSMRLQRQYNSAERQQLADLYIGTISYLPLDEFCPEEVANAGR